MADIQLIIEERQASIGLFKVGRLLPFRQKRLIGPFIYMDHMGPVTLDANHNFDVLPHPHIGLSTLTYLFEGSIMHRDSLGNSIEIKPGEVNWMTAGKGIVHSERTPDDQRGRTKNLHGLQIWIALPKIQEQSLAGFVHFSKEQIPEWHQQSLKLKLIAGELFGKVSPVPVFSPLFLLEIKSPKKQVVDLSEHLFGEFGIYILEGGISLGDSFYRPGQLLVWQNNKNLRFGIEAGSTVFIFGGEAFPENRIIDWNFVSSDQNLINEARQNWQNRTFGTIESDREEWMPYPSTK